MDLLFIFISPKGYKYSLPSQDIFVHKESQPPPNEEGS